MRKVSRRPLKQPLPAVNETTCSNVGRFKIKLRFVTNCEIGAKNIAGWIPHENSLPARQISHLETHTSIYPILCRAWAPDVNALQPHSANKLAASG
jgi:hypothetical protein